MFHVGTVPGHVDGLDSSKGTKRLSNCLLTKFKVDTAYIYTAEGSIILQVSTLSMQMQELLQNIPPFQGK